MRIILDYRPALRERTGVGEYVHELARALAELARRGPDATGDEIVAFSSSWKDRMAGAGLEGIETVDARIPVRVLNFAWHRLSWPPVERLTGPADIAHSAHPLLMPSRTAAQVITIHDLDFLDHPERTGGEIRRDYPALAGRHARRADLVVVSSQQTASRVAGRLNVPEDRIALCPAGAPPWPARRTPPPAGYFLFVGTLEPRKNVGALLGAYERLLATMPEAPPLRLAGKAPEGSEGWLARADQPPLRGRVRHMGYVPAGQRQELYAGAVALLLPSLYEGFGLTALEAMTAGVPVIASARGSLPEVIGESALFIDPESEESIAAAMARIVTEPAMARALARAGRTRAETFSWRRSAEMLREAYGRALSRRRARA